MRNIHSYFIYFFLLLTVPAPVFLSGQDSGGVRYKPSVVLLMPGGKNITEAYSNLYSSLEECFGSFEGIKLITNRSLLDSLQEKMPRGGSYFISFTNVKDYAYKNFIDEVFLISNGNTAEDFFDFSDIHVDDDRYFDQISKWKGQEISADYFVHVILTNFFTYGDSRSRYNSPDFLNFSGKFKLKDLKTGKTFDLEKYIGRFVVLTQFPSSSFDYSKYMRMKYIFSKLNYKFPDIVTIFGIYDTGINEKLNSANILKEMDVMDDPGLTFPVVDVTSLPRDEHSESYLGACYYGYLTGEGITNRQFEVYAHERFIFRIIEDTFFPEKQGDFPVTLVEAARDDDFPMVTRLIKEGADPLVTEDYRYALDWAVYYNNSAMIDEITGARTSTEDIYHAASIAVAGGKNGIFAGLMEKINRLGKPDILRLKNIFSMVEQSRDKNLLSGFSNSFPAIPFFFSSAFSFENLVRAGIKPGIEPDYPFPVSLQPHKSHECELYAMKHVLKYKYNFILDIPGWEKIMKKGKLDEWYFPECASVAYGEGFDYEINIINRADPGLLFYYLSKGEPVITEREYGSDNHRHSVVAYSYDENGVWLSDSAIGKRWEIPVEKLITNEIFTMRVLKKAGSK